MNKEQNISQLEDQALDIVNAGTAITDAQLKALRESEELRREVTELQQLGAYVRRQDVDVEARLREFHGRHQGKKTASARTYFISFLAVAAMFIGVLLLRPTQQPSEDIMPRNTVFVGTDHQTGITLTTPEGEQIALSANTQQNTSLTLDDFRKVFSQEENVERVTLDVPVGKSADITLPDGSVAYLHPGSKAIFPTVFVGGQRVVQLEGQAYFKVTKDEAHPFVVITENLQTIVLGTEFHINSKAGEVVLVSGSVQVSVEDQKALLKPGQKATLTANDLELTTVSTEPYKYWRDGYLYFDNVELKDIMESIGANFNMTVEFHNTEALHYRMRFISERNNGVDVAIEMMNRMKKVTVSKKGNKIIVD